MADVRLAELRTRIGELEAEAVVSRENLDRADRHALNLGAKLETEIADRTAAETQLAAARMDLRTQAAAHEASLAASQSLVADLRAELERERDARRRAETVAAAAGERASAAEDRATKAITRRDADGDREGAEPILAAVPKEPFPQVST